MVTPSWDGGSVETAPNEGYLVVYQHVDTVCYSRVPFIHLVGNRVEIM